MGRDQYLTRFAYTPDGVFGRWGRFQTVEEEWRDNAPRISCIPTGIYRCVRSMFHRGGYATYEITNVPGRSLIKVHRANTEEDLLGCIGLGLSLGVLRVKDEDSGQMAHKLAALASRKAHDAWMASLAGVNEFQLHVVDYTEPAPDWE
tara:strand:+ start:2410 stop:2853 length:444 start_codon:yes stop_codon:yes gene_type:complete